MIPERKIRLSDGRVLEYVDTNLVRESKEGDLAAFQRLFDKYHRRVYNLVYRMVGNEQDASDLTQEVFVRVYNSLHLLKNEEAFFTWVRTVAVNICRDHFRKIGRTVRTDSLDEKINLGDGEVEREIEDWSANPERLFEKNDLKDAVQRAVISLSEDHREVVVLHHIEGMDIKDIAKLLHVPTGTVKSRLARAREELKRKLGHYVV